MRQRQAWIEKTISESVCNNLCTVLSIVWRVLRLRYQSRVWYLQYLLYCVILRTEISVNIRYYFHEVNKNTVLQDFSLSSGYIFLHLTTILEILKMSSCSLTYVDCSVRAANAAVRQSKSQSILGPVLPSTLIRDRAQLDTDTWYMIQDTWYRRHNTGYIIQICRWYRILDTGDMKQDTWYRIQDTGDIIQDTLYRYRIQDTGYMIQETWYRIHDTDTWYRYLIQDTGYRIHDTGYMIQDTWYRRHDTGYMIQDTWYRYLIRDTGYRIQDTWYMIQDTWYRYRIQDTGYMIQDTWFRIHDIGYMIQER